MDKSLSKLSETVKDREAWGAVVHEATMKHIHGVTEQCMSEYLYSKDSFGTLIFSYPTPYILFGKTLLFIACLSWFQLSICDLFFHIYNPNQTLHQFVRQNLEEFLPFTRHRASEEGRFQALLMTHPMAVMTVKTIS